MTKTMTVKNQIPAKSVRRHLRGAALLVGALVVGSGCTSDGSSTTELPGSDGGTVGDAATASDLASSSTASFSFFVTSLKVLQQLSGSQLGFGGDLRYGETGPGAGLRGADKLCRTIAERSLPGSGQKTWRAFLSAVADENGQQVNAIDRIGTGPWYDRLGRVLAMNKAGLLNIRPQGGNAAIQNDFPNEDGVPNHQPDPGQPAVDNHDMLTGTGLDGKLYDAVSTCKDWTANLGDKIAEGKPRVGHSWPRGSGGGMGGSVDSWMSSLTESGCAPGVNLIEMGPPMSNSNTVGSGGGYGGFYCFALTP